MDKQVIAIGGGGFGRNPGNGIIEKYILDQSGKKIPNICFIPTATGDDESYKVSYYSTHSKLDCNPTHLDLFKRTPNLEQLILSQDIIFVGGGNTKSMLSVWREWGLNDILREAYDSGVIMSGVSAGAICWFEKGITDSWADDLAVMECMGFVDGICCPHYDEEPERRPFVKKVLENNTIDHCLGVEGNCALHMKDGVPFKAINFGSNKNSYMVTHTEGDVLEKSFERIDI